MAWRPGHDRDPSAASRLHGVRRLRDENARLWRESAAARELSGSLISLAALTGAPVKDPSGATVGRLRDVVVHWTAAIAYPAPPYPERSVSVSRTTLLATPTPPS